MIKNKLGSYNIGFKLGCGVDSICYFGTKENKEYCLKVINVEIDETTKRNRVINEIEALKRLRGEENIINFYESFILQANNKEMICICTELMPISLSQYLYKKNGKIGEKLCKKISYQIIKALTVCHENLIVHNDIKSENVVIDPKTLKVKLIDFGLSSVYNSQKDIFTSLKKTNGTPLFLSPVSFMLSFFSLISSCFVFIIRKKSIKWITMKESRMCGALGF